MSTITTAGQLCTVRAKANNLYKAFRQVDAKLHALGGSVANSCIRTWIYVKDIGKSYSMLVKDRNRFFKEAGISGSYLASTGVQIDDLDAPVTVAAYSMIGLDKSNIQHLGALSRMPHPIDYGVAFERGTRLKLGNRYIYFVSGTASLDKFGNSMYAWSTLDQLERTMDNIEAVLASGRASLGDIKTLTVYLKNLEESGEVMNALERYSSDCVIDIVHGVICRPELSIEIECVASRRAQ